MSTLMMKSKDSMEQKRASRNQTNPHNEEEEELMRRQAGSILTDYMHRFSSI